MEERNTEVTTIIRAKNPDELVVYHAESFENEIRFYINETQYIYACEKNDDNIVVGLGKAVESKKEKIKVKLAKEDHLKIFLICFGVAIVLGLITISSLLIGAYFNSMLMYLIMLNTLMFAFDIVRVIILENKTTSPCLKSKHSAEHMMANFLQKHKRLPKSIAEVKTASRFCDDCGSRNLINGIAEEFVSKIFASLLSVTASTIYLTFFSNDIVDLIIFIGVYLAVLYFLRFLFKKSNKLNFLLKPIKKWLTNLAQCANTTKKVEEDDIYLAYLAAKEWIMIVYPEYYNKEEDTFIKSFFA